MFKLIARMLTNCLISFLLVLFFTLSMTGCSAFRPTFTPISTKNSGVPITAITGPLLVGLIYTNVRYPLTIDLNETQVPDKEPPSDQLMDIKAPLGGRVQIRGNAIGAIGKQNGMQELYFADQHHFSILGFWSTHKTIIYGK